MPTLQEQIAQVLAAQSARPRRPALGRSILQAPKVTAPPPDARAAVRQAVLGAGRAGLSMLGAIGEALDQRPRGVPRHLSTSPGRLLNLPGSVLAAGASGLLDTLTGARTPVNIDPMGTTPQTSFADVGQRIGGTPGALAGVAADMAVPGPGELGTLGKMGTLSPMKGMLVYHGTGHRFSPTPDNPLGAFDASKIGTGEGAQAYSHGLYFAESPQVGRTYKNALKGGREGDKVTKAVLKVLGRPYYEAADDEWFRHSVRSVVGEGEDAVRNEIIQVAKRLAASDLPYRQRIAGDVRALADNPAIVKAINEEAAGYLYTADLPDEMVDRMLDWDARLGAQPESAREALLKIPDVAEEVKRLNAQREALNAQNPERLSHPVVGKLAQKETTAESLKGQALYDLLAKGSNRVKASAYLRSLGIPGVKYLDAGSRYGGIGTRNFVVFPGEEQKVKILKRE